MDPLTVEQVQDRQYRLLAWYDATARDLPWRRATTLYGTWIAEIMLQQTTVKTVTPRWLAFLEQFPDVAALAAAEEADVLAAWSGLGYYRRARHLHAAARQVMADHGGRLPTDRDSWQLLPGVGDYAAGAIASIGLGQPVPAVDANVRRVMMRWHCADPAAAASLKPAAITDLAAAHVVAERPGDWNQALMDLGAGPCRAGPPDCTACPVRETCAAAAAGTAALVPPVPTRAEVLPVVVGSLVLRRADRVLLLPSEQAVVTSVGGLGRPRRRDLDGLFTGMLALPSTPWYPAPAAGTDVGGACLAAWRRWLASHGGRGIEPALTGSFRHAITVHRLQVLTTVAVWPASVAAPDIPGAVWERLPGPAQPLATLARRALDQALECRKPQSENDL